MRRLILLLVPVMALSSCMTYDYVPENKSVTKKVGDVSITLTYMTASELRKLHGTESNPFIDMPKGVFQRDLIIFECELESESTVLEIASPKITLDLGGKTDKAKTVITYMLYWKGYVDDSKYNAMTDKCKLYLIPQNFTVKPNKRVKGYLVFFNNFPPEMGNAVISIPATTDDGDYGVIEIPFFLDDPRARAAAEKRKQRKQKKSGTTDSEKSDEGQPSIFDQQETQP